MGSIRVSLLCVDKLMIYALFFMLLNHHYLHISCYINIVIQEHISFFLQLTFQQEGDLKHHHKLCQATIQFASYDLIREFDLLF